MKRIVLIAGLSGLMTACQSTNPTSPVERVPTDPAPGWARSSKVSWAEGSNVNVRSQFTVRGDERVNGCYQLAKLGGKETLVREIAEDFKGQIDNAQQSLSENAENLLTESRMSEFSGRVTGMRLSEQFSERVVGSDGQERLDCYVLFTMKQTDYDSVRRSMLYKLVEADPGLKEILKERQRGFFGGGAPVVKESVPQDLSVRAPSAVQAEEVEAP